MTEVQDLKRYELMLILSGDMPEKEFFDAVEKIKQMLAENTKGIAYEDIWGKRELVYKIKRHRFGYYVIFNFDADPKNVAEIKMNVKLNPHVLRHLVLLPPEGYDPARYKSEILKEEQSEEDRAKKFKKAVVKEESIIEEKKPSLATKQEEEELEAVTKKLDKILENPDIEIK